MSSILKKKTFSVGISPCPNDTYIFGAWVLGMAGDIPGCRTRFVWEDVQTLNEMAEHGRLDLVKISAVQALKLQHYDIIDCGGAFGLGHGPRLAALPGLGSNPASIAVPGMLTTAYTLLRSAADYDFEAVPMPFDQIPAAITQGRVEAGLLIHETALLHKELGLDIILDIGKWWDETTRDLPLPLGLIAIKKSADKEVRSHVEHLIRLSISMAAKMHESIRPLIRSLARELDDRVIDEHIRAYVNEYSSDMGESGRKGLAHLKELSAGLTV